MHFRFIWVGKTRNEHLRALVDDYSKRLSRFVKHEITEVRESAAGSTAEGIEDEGKRIISGLRPDALTILLDVEGHQWSSRQLAGELEKWQSSASKEVAMIIGGHSGVSSAVAAKADKRWSLSPLTFTHEMARVLMLEQIYRAYTIIRGLPYQK
jgi:23S rRNA (pseudouridine1915-N3)-methyltransferase